LPGSGNHLPRHPPPGLEPHNYPPPLEVADVVRPDNLTPLQFVGEPLVQEPSSIELLAGPPLQRILSEAPLKGRGARNPPEVVQDATQVHPVASASDPPCQLGDVAVGNLGLAVVQQLQLLMRDAEEARDVRLVDAAADGELGQRRGASHLAIIAREAV